MRKMAELSTLAKTVSGKVMLDVYSGKSNRKKNVPSWKNRRPMYRGCRRKGERRLCHKLEEWLQV